MFGGEFIFRRVGLCLLEPQLQLVEQPRRALGAQVRKSCAAAFRSRA